MGGRCLSWGAALHAQPCRRLVLQARFFNDTAASQQLHFQADVKIGRRARLVPHVAITQEDVDDRIGFTFGCRLELTAVPPAPDDEPRRSIEDAMSARSQSDGAMNFAAVLHMPGAHPPTYSLSWACPGHVAIADK
ncbi:hypothetical protein PLESTB_000820700 [Pleodorina starrii]|uniref:Uncharacterized protein n=1 Tax=Pleodorina starrii TaxID=330485 RepID=A0A9W6F2C2_9CHLO|nr:hypothetical protein PLESTB_000820700 [Pleodorina starrii]